MLTVVVYSPPFTHYTSPNRSPTQVNRVQPPRLLSYYTNLAYNSLKHNPTTHQATSRRINADHRPKDTTRNIAPTPNYQPNVPSTHSKDSQGWFSLATGTVHVEGSVWLWSWRQEFKQKWQNEETCVPTRVITLYFLPSLTHIWPSSPISAIVSPPKFCVQGAGNGMHKFATHFRFTAARYSILLFLPPHVSYSLARKINYEPHPRL